MLPLTVPEVRRLLWRLVLEKVQTAEEVLGWSQWRRQHQAQAKHYHYKRRGASLNDLQL